MIRNQLSKDVEKYSAGVMFTVDAAGNIEPKEVAVQCVKVGGTIITKTSTDPAFSGRVCVRAEDGSCQCSAVVGVASSAHMEVNKAYTIGWAGSVPCDFEIYAIDGKVPNTTNGKIRVGG
jgi:hypothetical protein